MFSLQQFLGVFWDQLSAFISAIGTLLLFHKATSPRLEFSELIRSEDVVEKDRSRYSVKLKKHGLIDLVDVKITCRLYVKDIFLAGSKAWTTYNIPTTYPESVVLGRDSRVVYLSLHKSLIVTGNNGLEIKKRISERYNTSTVRFEYIFMIFRSAYLEVDVIGNDRFTGVLKVYSSHRYGLWAFQQGKWRLNSCKLTTQSEV